MSVRIINSGTQRAFDDAATDFTAVFRENEALVDIYGYTMSRLKDKRKFVSFWNDRWLLMGKTSTSRVEGAHS